MEVFTRSGVPVSRSDVHASPVNLMPGRNVVGVDLGQIRCSMVSMTSTSASSIHGGTT